ncbi:sensor histidine kinase [Saccharopolyspora hirsuta]|uniref:histidine kinase n=1 Tax=Saccharopolyspora hirsuta TaxID=1837 RepID=A0A5M7BJB0_SACHI|nr:sensor histidine kinase [Saccharopolyspora hirsuta]KAA5830056.1 sensor histidine kinase [Saccharopolyspora hirsuta]MBF6507503.1 sensor histidine kinase [Nocardia farcinica]
MVDHALGRTAATSSRTGLWAWLVEHRAVLGDIGFVLVLAVAHGFDLSIGEHPPWMDWWWPLLVSVPATALLVLRRRAPWTVFLVILVVTIALTLLKLYIGGLNLAILVAIYSVCVRGSLAVSVVAGTVAMIFPVTQAVVFELTPVESFLRITGGVVNLVMVIGWARTMQIGRQRAAQLEQTLTMLDEARDQLAADAAVVERARIAREFHDIVSHNLSVVALRAGVARALIDRDREHARQTLQELEQSSRSALGEMRNLLNALRDSNSAGQDPMDWQPTPRLDGVDALVDSVRGGRVEWRFERRGQVRELGPGVEMTAYRIVQEAMTNVLKHAGSGRARVLLDYGPSALRIEVTNHQGAGEVPPVSHFSGHGLIGLRERVALLGGTLTAHPVLNGFHLEAVLPCAENSDLA